MLIKKQTKQLSSESLSETKVIPIVPFATEERSNPLNIVLERLLHPHLTAQVFSDTLVLNRLTREHLADEKGTPLAYAEGRLAVFELGLQAMLECSDFKHEERNHLFEKINLERAIWDERVWELLVESGEYRHQPIGFYNQKV